MPRPPTIQDFPPSIQSSILVHSSPTPRSLLILFHGLGDTNVGLSQLGKNLNLPHTATISIKAPSPIPALFMGSSLDGLDGGTGWHWGDDILVDNSTGELDLDTGFNAAAKAIGPILKVVLGRENAKGAPVGLGFETRDIFLWGLGHGGMVALSLAEQLGELGGVVSIGAKIASSKSAMNKAVEGLREEVKGKMEKGKDGKAKTPVLLCGGNRKTAVTAQVLRDVKERFSMVQYVKWEREGDSMARNREEMLPIMKFLASRLRMPTPGGMEEVGGVSRA